ncbi:MAG TPA: DUF4350 domain-containing protein, partial [Kofleriaceae bacterium]|nr:DUF4350 domain-containing protein [Kofleriaceae bacterium]
RSDVVFFLYPTARIDPTHLDSFVRNGGRVLLADDFGETDAALGRLGILRGGSDAAAASEFWDDQLFAPIARPLARHPLTDGVDSVTTNYPAVWRTTGAASPVIGFDDGSSVVAALVQGDGRLVALSDPSVLINRMLEFDGNLAFAINLLRWLGRDEQPRRLVVMTGDVMLFGEPSRMIGDGHPPGSMAGLLERFNIWLGDLKAWQLQSERAVAVVIAILLALGALLVLPRRRREALDGRWTRARSGAEPATTERLIRELGAGGRRASFVLPAAVLRDTVNARLAALLGQPDPLYAVPEGALIAAVRDRRGPPAAAALADLYPLMRGLPTRAQAASPWQAPFFAQRDFERISAAAERLYRSLGE